MLGGNHFFIMQDLIEISISLPHVMNNLPVVLTQHPNKLNFSMVLLETLYDRQQVCSSMNNFDKNFQSSITSWYSSLNYTSCNWIYSTWFPLGQLVQCEANITLSNFRIAIDIFVVYFYVDFNQAIQMSAIHTLKSELLYSAVNPCLPAPIHYHPEVHGTIMDYLYAYPISVGNIIYFYIVVQPDFGSPVINSSMISTSNLLLLHHSTMRKSAWKLWSDESVMLDVIFHEHEPADDTISPPFKLMLNFVDSTCVPVLKCDSLIHLKGNSSSVDSEFEIGK